MSWQAMQLVTVLSLTTLIIGWGQIGIGMASTYPSIAIQATSVSAPNGVRIPLLIAQSHELSAQLEHSEQLYKSRAFPEALRTLNKTIEISPDYAPAWYLKGRVLIELKEYYKAIESLNEAIRYDRRNPTIWQVRGDAMLSLAQRTSGDTTSDVNKVLDRYKFAIESYDRALELFPLTARIERTEISLSRSFALFGQGHELSVSQEKLDDNGFKGDAKQAETEAEQKYVESVASYDQAISLISVTTANSDQLARALRLKGEALRRLKKYSEALQSFERLVQLEPNSAEGWYRKGRVLEKLRRQSEALKAYELATKIDPDYADAWYNWGRLLINLAKYKDALISFDQAIQGKIHNQWRLKADLTQADSWYGRGQALIYLGCYSQAISAFDRAIELNPDFLDASTVRKKILPLAKQPNTACQK